MTVERLPRWVIVVLVILALVVGFWHVFGKFW